MEQFKGRLNAAAGDKGEEGASSALALQPCLDQLAKSIKAETAAVKELTEKRWEEANENQYGAVDSLALALEAFPEMRELDGEGEEDPAAQGKWTGRVEDGAPPEDGQPFEITAGQTDPVTLTAPPLSAEAILREEIMNRRQRQRKRSAQYGQVERNW